MQRPVDIIGHSLEEEGELMVSHLVAIYPPEESEPGI